VFTWDGRGAPDAQLAIYDVAGRAVRTLHEGPLSEGPHTWEWQARSESGVRLASGVYFARLRVGTESTSLKVIVR
jgi:flagellar hook assembly protein FlgD